VLTEYHTSAASAPPLHWLQRLEPRQRYWDDLGQV